MKSCNWGRKCWRAPSLFDSPPTNSYARSISFPLVLCLYHSLPSDQTLNFSFRLAFSFAAYWHCRISLMAFWLRASSHFALCACVCVCCLRMVFVCFDVGSMCEKCTSCSIGRRSFISYWTIWPRMVSSRSFTSSNRALTRISVCPTVFAIFVKRN